MAGLFGRLGGEIKEDFNQSPIVRIIRALRQRRQAPQMAGSPMQQGVFTPGIFAEPPIPQAGPFGPVY